MAQSNAVVAKTLSVIKNFLLNPDEAHIIKCPVQKYLKLSGCINFNLIHRFNKPLLVRDMSQTMYHPFPKTFLRVMSKRYLSSAISKLSFSRNNSSQQFFYKDSLIQVPLTQTNFFLRRYSSTNSVTLSNDIGTPIVKDEYSLSIPIEKKKSNIIPPYLNSTENTSEYDESGTQTKRQSVWKTLSIIITTGGVICALVYPYIAPPAGSKKDLFPEKRDSSIFLTGFEKMEKAGEKITDTLHDLLDKYLPVASTPLLPDVADLKYPDNLPTLVVDLDKVIVKMEHDRKHGWRVLKRPGADNFFKELIYHYEIVVWSDDSFPVAQEVCAKWGVPIVGALHRDQCKKRNGYYIKDLNRLGRRLNRVLILDHDPAAFSLQPENGVLIREFDGNPLDRDLFSLTEFLKMAALSSTSDLREILSNFGGGDVDLAKRWAILQEEKEKKAESRRQIGSRFFGTSSNTVNPRLGRTKNTTTSFTI